MGYEACKNASDKELKQGNYGEGCGAIVVKIKGPEFAMKGGIGSYSIKLDNGLAVSALIAVNAFGDIYEDGKVIAGVLNDDKDKVLNSYELIKNGVNKGGCKKISQMAHNGYAKSIFPIHTPYDVDTIFTMATGEIE